MIQISIIDDKKLKFFASSCIFWFNILNIDDVTIGAEQIHLVLILNLFDFINAFVRCECGLVGVEFVRKENNMLMPVKHLFCWQFSSFVCKFVGPAWGLSNSFGFCILLEAFVGMVMARIKWRLFSHAEFVDFVVECPGARLTNNFKSSIFFLSLSALFESVRLMFLQAYW